MEGLKLARVQGQAVLDRLVDEFGIRVDLTERLGIPGLRPGSRVYRVKGVSRSSQVYILDAPELKDVACHPHIVGDELIALMERAALDASRVLLELTPIKEAGEDALVFEHILRAAPGYRLHAALQSLGIRFREVWVRPRYKLPSYRDHDEEATKEIEIIYEDFSQLPEGVELTVLKPDTEASGKTAEASLRRLVEEAEKRGSNPRDLIIYGFISEPGLRVVEETARRLGFKQIYFLAAGDVTALCHNMYDMPLYGPDESYYSEHHELKRLGGVADHETLERYIPEFIPGADQPGDWSARQKLVYTGTGYEPGGIEKHLKNSIELIERLWSISKPEPWFMEFHEEAAKRELELLRMKLAELKA
ncbi:MAG: hypothetical protein NXY59_10005 [Aigarchaeota archaeon]|nr:hypothetical protein [Candidatus Pelearchaeum maunauluense]